MSSIDNHPSNKILQLSLKQLESIEQKLQSFHTHSKPSSKLASRRVLISAIALSIILHLGLIIFVVPPARQPVLSINSAKTINIKFINNLEHNKSLTKTDLLKKDTYSNQQLSQTIPIQPKPVETQNLTINPSKHVSKTPIEASQSQAPKAKNAPTSQSHTTSINIENIRNNMAQYIPPAKAQTPSKSSNQLVFSQQFKDKIDKFSQHQTHRNNISREKQFRAANQYQELDTDIGGKIVRINGQCFKVPANDPFAQVPKNWSIIGNCANKKSLEFKPGLFSHKNSTN